MNYEHEFGTVELLINSEFETKGVDAFTISLLKAERQIRKIFTYLVYQHSHYNGIYDALQLRKVLFENGQMYFDNFIVGIDFIYQKSVEDLYGEDYQKDIELLKDLLKERNKIFHGQITNKFLSTEQLIERVESIKKWCKKLADKFNEEIGYDGFERNSYRKSGKELSLKNNEEFETVEKYSNFLKTIDRSKK
jgi:ribosomal protein S18